VAFDVEGVRTAIIDGETGVLVRDDDSFVAAWTDLVADTDRRLALGRQARARAEGFSWDASVERAADAADRAKVRR
jgi:D-inositol-3-phosphate glycosyltransferase